ERILRLSRRRRNLSCSANVNGGVMHLAGGRWIMIRTLAMRAFTSGALMVCLLLSSCAAHTASTRSVVALPNGYYIDRDRQSELRIVTRSGRKIIGPLSGYAVYADIVTGLVGP